MLQILIGLVVCEVVVAMKYHSNKRHVHRIFRDWTKVRWLEIAKDEEELNNAELRGVKT